MSQTSADLKSQPLTVAMIRAGTLELSRYHPEWENGDDAVSRIYEAMEGVGVQERRDAYLSAAAKAADNTLRVVATTPDQTLASNLYFTHRLYEQDGSVSIIGLATSRTPGGEFLNIKGEFMNCSADRREFLDLLRVLLEPGIIGIGKIRAEWREQTESVVIIPVPDSNDLLRRQG